MATTWNAQYVRCPFYHRDNGKYQIVCEGVTDGATLSMQFPSKAEFRVQMRTFCQGRYENCEVYRMLAKKYEEE